MILNKTLDIQHERILKKIQKTFITFLKEKMMLMYGCEAPWLMTSNNKTCETDLVIKNLESADIANIIDFVFKLQVLDMFDFWQDCPKSCVTMDIKLKTLLTGTKDTKSYLGVWKSKQVC